MGACSPFTLRVIIERYDFNDGVLPVKSLFLQIVTFCSVSLLGPFYFYRTSLSISCRAGLVVTNSINFFQSWKGIFSPSMLNDSLAG